MTKEKYDFKNYEGKQYGRLKIIGEGRIERHDNGNILKRYVICQCDCGTVKELNLNSLVVGNTKSCGCLVFDVISSHGMTNTTEYHIWTGIIQRCTNSNSKDYPRYGGRGICVCNQWRNSFQAFYDYVGPRPSDKHSIDRKDNNGHYEPGNVKWATFEEQASNRRNNLLINYNGTMLTAAQIARMLNISSSTVLYRHHNNIPIDKTAVRDSDNNVLMYNTVTGEYTLHDNVNQCVVYLSNRIGITYQTIMKYLNTNIAYKNYIFSNANRELIIFLGNQYGHIVG